MMRFINIVFTFVLLFATACTFKIKTPDVANYQYLDQISQETTKNDIDIMLGSPQGIGKYIINGRQLNLSFYYGFAGVFTFSTVKYDSGTAFIAYDNNELINIIYFTSKSTGPEIYLKKDYPVASLLNDLMLGQSSMESVYEVLGQPEYNGKRIDKYNGINHRIAFWDASQVQTKGAIKEKWILIGYDDKDIAQDLIWVSSYPDEIRRFGEVSEQKMKQLSRQTIVGFIPMLEPKSISTGGNIDTTQVDALLRSNVANISDVKKVLGNPTALGIKSFLNGSPMILSNWSFSEVEMKGQEHDYIPPGVSEEERDRIMGDSYMVMNITQSRLIIGHDVNGNIKEIFWVKPVNK